MELSVELLEENEQRLHEESPLVHFKFICLGDLGLITSHYTMLRDGNV